jgi:hypothetical protein
VLQLLCYSSLRFTIHRSYEHFGSMFISNQLLIYSLKCFRNFILGLLYPICGLVRHMHALSSSHLAILTRPHR